MLLMLSPRPAPVSVMERSRSVPHIAAFEGPRRAAPWDPNRGRSLELPRAWSAPPPKPPLERPEMQRLMLEARRAERAELPPEAIVASVKAAPKRYR